MSNDKKVKSMYELLEDAKSCIENEQYSGAKKLLHGVKEQLAIQSQIIDPVVENALRSKVYELDALISLKHKEYGKFSKIIIDIKDLLITNNISYLNNPLAFLEISNNFSQKITNIINAKVARKNNSLLFNKKGASDELLACKQNMHKAINEAIVKVNSFITDLENQKNTAKAKLLNESLKEYENGNFNPKKYVQDYYNNIEDYKSAFDYCKTAYTTNSDYKIFKELAKKTSSKDIPLSKTITAYTVTLLEAYITDGEKSNGKKFSPVEYAKLYFQNALLYEYIDNQELSAKNYKMAIVLSGEEVIGFTEDSNTLYLLAKAYLINNTKLDNALIIKILTKAVILNPKIYDGILLQDEALKQYAEKIDLLECYEEYVKQGKDYEAYYVLASNLYHLNNFQKSSEAYEKSVELVSNNQAKALSYLHAGIASHKLATDYKKQTANGVIYPLVAVQAKQQEQKAEYFYKKAIELNLEIYKSTENPEALFTLANIYWGSQEHHVHSIAALNKAVSLDPKLLEKSITGEKFTGQINLKDCFEQYKLFVEKFIKTNSTAEQQEELGKNLTIFAKEFEKKGQNELAILAYKFARPLVNDWAKGSIDESINALKNSNGTSADDKAAFMIAAFIKKNLDTTIKDTHKEFEQKKSEIEVKRSEELKAVENELNAAAQAHENEKNNKLKILKVNFDKYNQEELSRHIQARGNINDSNMSAEEKFKKIMNLDGIVINNKKQASENYNVNVDNINKIFNNSIVSAKEAYYQKILGINSKCDGQVTNINDQEIQAIFQAQNDAAQILGAGGYSNTFEIPPHANDHNQYKVLLEGHTSDFYDEKSI